MLTGAGSIILTTNNLDAESLRGENILMPGCVASFSLTPDETAVDAECLEDGILQVVDTSINKRIWNMTLEFQFQDWSTIQLAYDEVAQSVASVDLPLVKKGIVDAAGEIVDADVVAGVGEDNFLAYMKQDGQKPVFLKVVASAPAANDEIQYATGKLVLTAANAGKVVTYRLTKNYTNIETIGVATEYDKFGSLTFSGIIGFSGNASQVGMQLVVPRLNRVSTPELTVNGDLVTLSIEYRLGLAQGKRNPFELYYLEE